MDIISKIRIENFKGITTYKDYLTPNWHPNKLCFIIAPNGFGKSTIAKAVESLIPSKLFNKNFPNAELAITRTINSQETTLVANNTKNEINKEMFTYVINSRLYAKNTGRNINGYKTSSADLKIKDITIIAGIPKRTNLKYEIKTLREKIKYKELKSIQKELENTQNLKLISDNIKSFETANKRKTGAEELNTFINSNKTESDIQNFKSNKYISPLFGLVESTSFINITKSVPSWQIVVQLLILTSNYKFKEIYQYAYYSETRKDLDKKLLSFNTTKRKISTKETNENLVLAFPSANSLSNGERDILCFLALITAFKYNCNKKHVSLLIIDEIFDYLDGGNLLAAQYYLSELINQIKKEKKLCFCCILTHLDPTLFNTCYIKKPKFIYLYNCSKKTVNENTIKLLLARKKDSDLYEPISKHFLHYCNTPVDPDIESKIKTETGIVSCAEFHKNNFYELEKYIEKENHNSKEDYDPIAVICAIRYHIEKNIFEQLKSEKDKMEFLNAYKTLNKLEAVENAIDLDERVYFLAPLYNDALHMQETNKEEKIKLASLKLSSKVTIKIVTELSNNWKV